MANYTTLKGSITSAITQNGNKEITGALLQSVLLAMVNSLGAQFQFRGVATPGANPGTPDYNVAYIAGPGTYPNFGNKTVPSTYLGVLKYNGTWSVELIQLPVGSTVSVSPDLDTGTKIATITVNGTDYDLYAPAGGGGENYFEIVSNTVSLKAAYTGGITAPQGDITAPAGVVFGKSSGTITVGTGGDFNSLTAALAYASKYSRVFNNNGNSLTIEIKANFSIGEQIVVDGIDLSYVNITRAGYTPPSLTLQNRADYLNGVLTEPTVLVDLINNQTFLTLKNGAIGPRISCIFNAVSSRNVAGIVLEGGSKITIDPFCGLVDFRTPLVAKNGSVVIAYGGILKGGNNGIANIRAEEGSFVVFSDGMLSRVDSATIIYSLSGSKVVANRAAIKGDAADLSGLIDSEYAYINAVSLFLYDIDLEVYAISSTVSTGATGATIPVTVEYGSIVRLSDGTAVPSSGTINTISADGIIFN